MRKIFAVSLFVVASTMLFAQDDAIRNLRFGLKLTPTVNWFKPEGKIIKNDGIVMKYGGGLVLEYRLAKIISIQTGFQIDLMGGKASYKNGATLTTPGSNFVSYVYNTTDDVIVKYDTSLSTTSHNFYQLNKRNYTVTYLTFPISLKMKTKEIGSLTYYGQFGLNNSFRWKARANDEFQEITASGLGTVGTRSKIDVTKDVNLYMASLNMGLGAELNLSGSTSFTFGLNYNLGFTSVVKDNSEYLHRRAIDNAGLVSESNMPQSVPVNSISLLVGVLF